jgi:hypothetical protein
MKPATQPVTHTPGPWYVGAQNDLLYIINTKPRPVPADYINPGVPGSVVIARLRYHDVSPEVERANAAVLASAPELLRVAKDAADFLLRTARVLDEWAVQSQNGGWSTHQVEGNLRVANDCRREADCIQRVIDRATGAEGTRP